jgi:Holliday junction resolvase
LVAGFLIECKNCAKVEIAKWWGQACVAASQRGAVPCLAYKVPRKGWRFVVPSDAAMKAAQSWSFDLRYTQELYEEGFFLLVRERGA